MACNSCTILYKSAWTACCETLEYQCKNLAAQATEIECMIRKAEIRGDLFVYVNKHMLNQDIIDGLRESCYKVEFVPNSGGICCKFERCEDIIPNGVYKISWCVCTCGSSSSSCCEDLPDGCVSSSCCEEEIASSSESSEPIVIEDDCGC
jgi:hypothetical protein